MRHHEPHPSPDRALTLAGDALPAVLLCAQDEDLLLELILPAAEGAYTSWSVRPRELACLIDESSGAWIVHRRERDRWRTELVLLDRRPRALARIVAARGPDGREPLSWRALLLAAWLASDRAEPVR